MSACFTISYSTLHLCFMHLILCHKASLKKKINPYSDTEDSQAMCCKVEKKCRNVPNLLICMERKVRRERGRHRQVLVEEQRVTQDRDSDRLQAGETGGQGTELEDGSSLYTLLCLLNFIPCERITYSK